MEQPLNLSPDSQKPPNLGRKPLEAPSLERFYPTEDIELGIGASDIAETHRQRHYRRYNTIRDLLVPYIAKTDVIADVGSGSGYGSAILGERFRYVFGIEPNDMARAYASKHYPKIKFQSDLEGADVIVMIESIEHMTKTEVRSYIYDAKVVAVTTPLIGQPDNQYHISPFRCPEDVEAAFRREGFVLMESRLEKDITFTTGELGDQFYGIFGRPLTLKSL